MALNSGYIGVYCLNKLDCKRFVLSGVSKDAC